MKQEVCFKVLQIHIQCTNRQIFIGINGFTLMGQGFTANNKGLAILTEY